MIPVRRVDYIFAAKICVRPLSQSDDIAGLELTQPILDPEARLDFERHRPEVFAQCCPPQSLQVPATPGMHPVPSARRDERGSCNRLDIPFRLLEVDEFVTELTGKALIWICPWFALVHDDYGCRPLLGGRIQFVTT